MHFIQTLQRFRKARFIISLAAIPLLVAGFILPVGALTPTFKQAKGNEVSSGSVDNAAFASANTAGNLIVVYVIWNNTGTVSLSDTLGNTYAAATARTTWNASWSAQTFYAKNIAGGSNTVKATFATAINSFAIVQAHEYTGLDKANPLDGTSGASGTGTALNSGSLTTAATGDLLFGGSASAGAVSSLGSGFTGRLNTSGNRTMDKVTGAPGAYAATATHGGGAWVMQAAAFKADNGADTTPPAAPVNATATATSSSQITVGWAPATDNVGVTGYQIESCQGASCATFAQIATVAGNITSYNHTALAPSTLYRYRVRAIDAAGNLGAYSPIAQATTQGVPDTTAPSVPTGLTGTGTSTSQISLSWTASSDNVAVAGYKIYRNGTQVGTSATASFQDSGLALSTSYTYTVSAYDAASNNSAQSASAVASTLPDTTAPSVPTNLATQVVSSTQVNLTWTLSTDDVSVTGYKIYRDNALINTVTVTPVQDAGLTPGTTYSYAISAIDAAGNESAKTTPITATTPVPDSTPPSVSMTAPANGTTLSGTVTFSATASDSGTGVHDVEFLLDGVTINDDTTAPYSYAWDTTTTNNGVHYLAVRAHDNAGNFSNTSGNFTVTVNNHASQLPVDLMAGYNFNESTGTTTADVTTYGNNASFTSLAEPVWAAGKNGSGISFDGSTASYLSVGDSPTMDVTGTSLTLSMWIYPSGGISNDQVILGKFWNGSGSAPHYQYGLEITSHLVPNFYIGTSTGTTGSSTMGSSLATGQWSHLAVVYDGTHVSYYVNGNLIATPAMTGSIASRSGSTIRIGNDIDGSQGFKGYLDDVRLYKRVQTQAEVQADKNAPLLGNGTSVGPSVAITSPAPNAQVTGIITLTAQTSDETTGIQFFVDGSAVGAEDTATPFTANWDTRAASGGAHTITARAHDANGNTTVSNPVVVNVVNGDTFQNEILATGLNLPTAMKFLPDGRMLVAELAGKIRILSAPYTTVDPTPFLQITTGGAGVQEGIFDLALDPNYSVNHYFYIYYTATTGHDRLSRFTANASSTGTVAGSEFVMYEDPTFLQSDEHHGGAIVFGNDGKLYFTTGEHFQGTPAQDLTSPYGKVHRINMDGTVPTDNPYYDGAGPHWDSIWAIGLRNPYRAYYDAPTGRLLIGDVGGNEYTTAQEEVDLGAPGANYGWPNCELGTCNQGYTPALYAYAHAGRDASITGGFVYHGNGLPNAFPAGFEGSYFFGDYAQNWIKRLTFDPSGNTVTGVFNFEPASGVLDGPYGDIVYLTEGPEGSLYYLDLGYSDTSGTFGISKIRRIRYQSANQSPSAVAVADKTSGATPLDVNFSSAGSADPEGQPLTYSWDFGDGSPLSTAANPAHTYTTAGVYTVRLTVSDGVNNTFSPPVTISAGSIPTATITAPTDGITFRGGDVITYSGNATDPDDGTLPASAYSWTIDFLHEGHVHPGPTATGLKSGTFAIPTTGHDFSGNTRYRVTLTVTDSTGLTNTTSVIIWPQKVNLTFNSAPTGLTLYLDGIAKTSPFTYDTLIGFNHTIEARNQTVGSTNYSFSSWSDGGAQQHVLVVPSADQSYTVNYTGTSSAAGPVAAWGFNEGAGTTSADATGNGSTATLVNGPTWSAGKHGSGLTLDGTNDYLSFAGTSHDISGTNLTLSMWINPGSVSGDSVVLGKFWNTTMTSPYYQYGIELSGGRPNLQIGTASGTVVATMDTALALNQWTYLTIVWNGSQALFYTNGTLVSTKTLNATITARGNALRLGSDNNNQQYFKGQLDDVRIYNRALTAADVQTDMNTGL